MVLSDFRGKGSYAIQFAGAFNGLFGGFSLGSPLVLTPKLKYGHSRHNNNPVLFVSIMKGVNTNTCYSSSESVYSLLSLSVPSSSSMSSSSSLVSEQLSGISST